MRQIIEELANEYYLNNVINGDTCDGKDGWTDCFVSGAEALMKSPLAQRLTAQEKERVKRTLNMYYGKWREHPNEASEAVYCTIKKTFEAMFGTDFFKEGE